VRKQYSAVKIATAIVSSTINSRCKRYSTACTDSSTTEQTEITTQKVFGETQLEALSKNQIKVLADKLSMEQVNILKQYWSVPDLRSLGVTV